ncbi:hypothetical protein [Chitinivorax sp. B]|uniref:hypothetical protein n=1 Tax=Chitinivorax sp. B TaxID=2502235 RepID=UPI0010F6523D|nr:hypothetical protein [Chitinivorax sp. B]
MRFVALLGLLVLPVALAAETSLCGPGETVYYTCVTKTPKGRKWAALCGEADQQRRPTWLQYRFGKPGAIEFAYPAEHAGSLKKFMAGHYLRPYQGPDTAIDFGLIRFKNGAFDYVLEYSADDKSATRTISVKGPGVDRNLTCLPPLPPTHMLSAIESLPCDPDFPMPNMRCAE